MAMVVLAWVQSRKVTGLGGRRDRGGGGWGRARPSGYNAAMTRSRRRVFVPLLLGAALAGCDGTPEGRLEAAIPVHEDVANAYAAMKAVAKDDAALDAAIEQEYRRRLRERISTCARGYQPPWYLGDEGIRHKVGNDDCFREADAAIAQWLGLRRLALVLVQPPLRPVPSTPAIELPAEPGVVRGAFARDAGVAALPWKGRMRILDLATGKPVLEKGAPPNGQPSVSDNGRVVAISGSDGIAMFSTDVGEPLVSLPDAPSGTRVGWLGARGFAYLPGDGATLVVHDLASDRRTVLPFAGESLAGIVAAPGKPGLFVVVAARRVGLLDLGEPGANAAPMLSREFVRTDEERPFEEPALAANGRLYLAAGTSVQEIDPGTLDLRTLSFAPMPVARVLPTSDPGRLLLTLRGADAASYLYALDARTLMRVERVPGGSVRAYYVPSIRRLAADDLGRLRLTYTVADGEPRALAEVLDEYKAAAASARAEIAQSQAQAQARYGKALAELRTAATTPLPAEASTSQRPERTPGPAKPVRRGHDGLVDALRAGTLRLGTVADLERWKRSFEQHQRRAVPKRFDEWAGRTTVYVITGEFTVPEGLDGSGMVLFVLEQRVPMPEGAASHSPVLDLATGGCEGGTCRMFLPEDEGDGSE
jgi:hypothetical protein